MTRPIHADDLARRGLRPDQSRHLVSAESGQRYRPITRANVQRQPFWEGLPDALKEAIEVISLVLPFRTNQHVTEGLIDWSAVPDDPVFQLTFPQRGMISDAHYDRMADLLRRGTSPAVLRAEADEMRRLLNPHPAGQLTHNLRQHDGKTIPGLQHKYRETVLFFPSQSQTCHAYCSFCFRWAQFVGNDALKLANNDVESLRGYLRTRPEVTDLLLTGGDPMVMKAPVLARYLNGILEDPELEHVRTIRIGSKSLSFWPHRFVSDGDAPDLLGLFERVVKSGRHLAFMAHFCTPREIAHPMARAAIARIRATGAVVRLQSPVVAGINDDANTWAELWNEAVSASVVPYYMFVPRDTGARAYFGITLLRAWEIFRGAYARVSGLGRTARGPVMSCFPGKVRIDGVTRRGGEPVFVLDYLQCRRPELVRQPFFARFDERATWFDDLEPASEEDRRFFPQYW